MIVVSEIGSKIMGFSSDFTKYAEETLHIINPFRAYYSDIKKYHSRQSDGTITIDIEASRQHDKETRASREEWVQLRDKYVAERILRELGYEVLVTTHYAEHLPDAIPCEGATGQCSFYCPKYFECGL